MKSRAKKILIFDDDEDILSICKYILEQSGCEVYVFTECDNIVEKVSALMPDVILMDDWLPKDGGILATQTIKKTAELANIPVVYFTANTDIRSLSEIAGADAFLAKPFDIDELERTIDSIV